MLLPEHADGPSLAASPAPTVQAAPLVSLRDVHLSFGGNAVLKGIDLEVRRGQAVSIIGPSGSGKSTILRCITGLLEPQQGSVTVDGVAVRELRGEADRIALRKRVGFVFQQYNLFPHLTVLQNLTIAPLRVLGRGRAQAEATAIELLRKVRLADKAGAYPGELSGGQQQRVAIARALAMEPELILFDEVTSALDPETVGEVLTVIGDLVAEGLTCLLVTHEMRFAEEISDEVYFTEGGRIVEHGPARRIFSQPASDRTRAFLNRALGAQARPPVDPPADPFVASFDKLRFAI
ncbi:amino acid ABC transporter ATP-binding protein [Cupriavidus sp. 30B13]|uniref:amino acid ABC transporter ATP-binding protein n=1 Tax=Cupriavidus sp. 30B13 TaxID=3384241 RepID=UPI003B8FEB8C